jgi:hypothetical protein
LLTKYYSGDQSNEGRVGVEFGTYGEKSIYGFGFGNLQKSNHVEGLSMVGMIIIIIWICNK